MSKLAKPDIWMPLFIGDYLADTMHLTTTQHGAFLLLLLHAWRTGGYVPDNDATLAAITRMTLEDWQNNRAVIVGLLEKRELGYCYPRQVAELEKASGRSKVAFDNGIKGGRPKNNPTETQPITQTKPNSKPKPNPDETSLPSPLPLPLHTPVPSPAPPKKTLAASPRVESATPKPPRPRNELWDAVADEFFGGTVTAVHEGQVAKVVKDLKTLGATPGIFKRRVKNYRLHMPNAVCTPTAVVKHWGLCANEPLLPGQRLPMSGEEEDRIITEAWEQDNGPDLVRRAKEQAARELAEKQNGGSL